MLDGAARRLIGPGLGRMGKVLAERGISANAVTLSGFAIGLLAAAAIAAESYWLGLALVLASRLCDGLDGAVARHHGKTDLGGYLDIVLDFGFYGAIPLAFVLARPEANAVAGAVLIASFYLNGASFLAFAIMAEKRGLSGQARGPKSLYFTTGLAEASETIGVFCLMCLLPGYFAPLAYLFAAACGVTAAARIGLAVQTLR